ncbi:hypothetical protein [Nonomuraea sp. NPDC050691]|uniref:hypothetical protein n=1 Tax=Nonomuraea sp. NPDC050691 TaxID=3155661 RepID=UPI0033FEA7FB
MDPLVLAAGTAVVTAMATDGWQRACDAVVALWRRRHPERAPAVEAELLETRAEVLAARESGDSQTEAELAAEWQSRLRRLTADDPRVAEELRHMLDALAPLLREAGQPSVQHVIMNARASEHGRVYQAAHDQHITE